MSKSITASAFLSAETGARLARGLIAILALAAAACAPLPPRAGVPVEVRPSPNFDERRPNFVILHHTSDEDAAQALATLRDPARKVSSHYLIARGGKIYYLVDELARAWHAGESYWGGNRDQIGRHTSELQSPKDLVCRL